MFLEFLYLLRSKGLPVGAGEWLVLCQALEKGLARESVSGFYYLSRSILCRSEMDFDTFDQCFLEYFEGLEANEKIDQNIWEWLAQDVGMLDSISEEDKKRLSSLTLDELKSMFEKRLEEQKEKHDGGSHWVGSGGTSPFGHSGYHPSGVRVAGTSRLSQAMQVAAKRQFRSFRKDLILDTRQITVALKKLREWSEQGPANELDLDASIEATSKNAGDLELIFQRPRRNSVKILLLMDSGGSMDYHAKLCDQLFSATVKVNHFKEFSHFYFHNCPYEFLYTDIDHDKRISTEEFLDKYDPSWYLVVVGDAAMNPVELLSVGGAIDYFHQNEKPGVFWLEKIANHFKKSVWLNPEPKSYWQIHSAQIVRKFFPDMFSLSLEGLEEAMDFLRTKSKLY